MWGLNPGPLREQLLFCHEAVSLASGLDFVDMLQPPIIACLWHHAPSSSFFNFKLYLNIIYLTLSWKKFNYYVCMHAIMACMTVIGQLTGVDFLCHVDSWDWTQVIMLGSNPSCWSFEIRSGLVASASLRPEITDVYQHNVAPITFLGFCCFVLYLFCCYFCLVFV